MSNIASVFNYRLNDKESAALLDFELICRLLVSVLAKAVIAAVLITGGSYLSGYIGNSSAGLVPNSDPYGLAYISQLAWTFSCVALLVIPFAVLIAVVRQWLRLTRMGVSRAVIVEAARRSFSDTVISSAQGGEIFIDVLVGLAWCLSGIYWLMPSNATTDGQIVAMFGPTIGVASIVYGVMSLLRLGCRFRGGK